MALQEISQASRLNSGADLWVVPETKSSKMAQKIDWYLNFQITRSARHQSKLLPEKVSEILQKSGLPTKDWIEKIPLSKKEDLLILSNMAFPNRWVMVIRGSNEFPKWIENIHERWLKMNSPSLRIFLPAGISGSQFENAWRKVPLSTKEEFQKIGFVLEA